MVEIFTEARLEATSYAEAITPPKPADGQNAAAIYEEVLSEFEDKPKWVTGDTYDGINIDLSMFDLSTEDMQAFLKEKQATLARIEEAASMPYYYRPLYLSYYAYAPPAKYSEYLNMVSTFALRACLNANEGRMKAALEDIKTIKRIAEDISRSSTRRDTLMAGLFQRLSMQSLEYVLAVSNEVNKIETLSVINEEDYIYGSTLRAIEMDQIFFMYNLLINDGEVEPYMGGSRTDIDSGAMFALKRYSNHTMTTMYRIFIKKHDLFYARERRQEVRQFNGKPLREIRDAMKEWGGGDIEGELHGGMMSYIHTQSYSIFMLKSIQAQAHQRLSNLALAATAYKADNGKYPASLDELKGKYITEISVDPFNGEPIKVKHVEGGMVLYSYGEDKVDNEGNGDDITFRLGKAYFDNLEEEDARREERQKRR